MTTDTVKNVKMTTELVVNFMIFETLATEKSATGRHKSMPLSIKMLHRLVIIGYFDYHPVT